MNVAENEPFWRGQARRVTRRINCGWWVERLNWILVTGFLLFAVVLLWSRSRGEMLISPRHVLIGIGVLLALSFVIAWLWSRSRFVGEKDGLIRLDDQWHLNNRLVSAFHGAAPWPAPPSREVPAPAAPPWRIAPAVLPSLVAALMIAAAWWMPLPEILKDDPLVAGEPVAWDQMEDWVETLEEEELIEPETLERLADQIEELREQPESEWFSHASLEASDSLKESLGKDIREMAEDFAAMERSLESLQTFSSGLSEAGKEMLLREYEEALKGLKANGLPLNEALAKQLEGIDPSRLGTATMGGLSRDDLKQLQQQLREGAQSLGSMEGLPTLSGEGGQMSLQPGNLPGTGGIQRGEGDAPIFFGDEDDLGTNQIEAISNDDFSRAAVGDLLGGGETEHEEDFVPTGPLQGGEVSSRGAGGDAVWKDTLLPDEQGVLKRYFK